MRQRKAKDLEERLEACRDFLTDSESIRENIPPGTVVEIGCGKGQFIIKKAAANPDVNYLAIEGQDTVILRAAEKAMAVSGRIDWPENVPGEERLEGITGELDNLKFMKCFVNGMDELFSESSLAGIYLNFSDPWPKARHAKRRLTYRDRLKDYAWAIRPGGFIEIKTDNEGLFEFTLEEIEAAGDLVIVSEMTRDLHGESCTFEARNVTTEYEDKFSGRGKNINYVKLIINKEK